MRNLVSSMMFICALSLFGGGQTTDRIPPAAMPDIATVTFCDLLKNPQTYAGKVIRTQAVFSRRGEEVTEFYCPACFETGRVEFDLDEGYDACTKPATDEKILKYPTVNVTITGRFVVARAGEGFGHMGLYRYKLVVNCIEKADVISKRALSADRLQTVRRRATCR